MATRTQTRVINSDLVSWVDDRGTTSIVKMVGDETPFTILGGTADWLALLQAQNPQGCI